MEINDIPNDVRQEALSVIRKTKQYGQLAAAYQQHRMRNNITQASIVKKEMVNLEQKMLDAIAKNYKRETYPISAIVDGMSKEDRDDMNGYANAIMMMSDVLEVIISEMNQKMKIYKPDFHIQAFDRLYQLSKEAQRQVLHFDSKCSDTYSNNLFGTMSDELYEMIMNKAMKFCRKMNEHKERLKSQPKENEDVA